MRTILMILAAAFLPTIAYFIRNWILSRIRLRPIPRGKVSNPGELVFRAMPNGAFKVQAMINGAAMICVVDTGADATVLDSASAQAAGFDIGALDYAQDMDTANGVVRNAAAAVTLDRVMVGPIEVRDVPAIVSRAPLSEPLLGMTFLNSLGSFEVRDGRLTMRA